MVPLLYWVTITVLVSLLVILSLYMILNVIRDVCFDKSERKTDTPEAEVVCLRKYQFDKYDVEDLTKIEMDYKTAIPNVTLVNEVEREDILRDILRKNERYETSDSDENSILSNELNSKYDTGDLMQSIDDLEFWDPQYIDLLKAIMTIENKAREIEEENENYRGKINDLKYYEMNEKYINLLISLTEIFCEREDLRKRKEEVMEFIEGCKITLKNRYAQTQ